MNELRKYGLAPKSREEALRTLKQLLTEYETTELGSRPIPLKAMFGLKAGCQADFSGPGGWEERIKVVTKDMIQGRDQQKNLSL